jgi:hypothetical protein
VVRDVKVPRAHSISNAKGKGKNRHKGQQQPRKEQRGEKRDERLKYGSWAKPRPLAYKTSSSLFLPFAFLFFLFEIEAHKTHTFFCAPSIAASILSLLCLYFLRGKE